MSPYLWITLAASVLCMAGLVFRAIRLIRAGLPAEFSVPGGNPRKAVMYSFTGAMSPQKKESAYLHLPTYSAGIIYHIGTFLVLAAIPFILVRDGLPYAISSIFAGFLLLSAACGIGILVKRIGNRALRELSNPDDYLSTLLVTLFQIATGGVLVVGHSHPLYYIVLSGLLLYIPVGKLKHLLYFFAARIHLGYFFGHRGTWPPFNDRRDQG